PIFKETARLHKPGGIIAFSVASLEKKASQAGKVVPDFIKKPTVWGIPIYMHSDNYIQYISQSLGFHINKQQKILVESGDKDAGDFLFKIFVLK
ncbi:hypothetical protein JW935_24700, partial [candidate division KSB1 bacterium]|nr:hypothetical protein [candidate division KSB1 bacterium]